ncbi:substrate-binding domain-containing protein [Salinibacterium sp.]|uniref:sugar ABC transporter substrate-binding protein n=1 Tax=Salinibacterium sp. TaxID=1915057 RepID=UPI00286C9877|nr:substrate-binding domain-containing protein [Salinibacterium sp.]
MSIKRIRKAAALSIAATFMLVSVSACATPTDTGSGTDGAEGVYTAKEVAEATGPYQVKPLFAVPKDIENLQLAFINPGESYAFFAAWSQGIKDAADFYGVTVDLADLAFKYENSLSAYEQLSVKQPVVVGSGGGAMNAPTVEAITANDAKVVVIDGAIDGGVDFGVSDDQVGVLAITTIADAVNEKLGGEWADKELIVAGISAANCAPCDARVAASFAEAQSTFGIEESATFRLEPAAGSDPTTDAANQFTDFLTAHPDAAIIVVSYGDAPVVGAVNATRAAGRAADVLAIASGGDTTSRAALRDPANASLLLGSIDYQPYSEGWNWVEAAIATHLGETFSAYEVTRVLTSDNVDELYPDDK